jgi:hypothetical protein
LQTIIANGDGELTGQVVTSFAHYYCLDIKRNLNSVDGIHKEIVSFKK